MVEKVVTLEKYFLHRHDKKKIFNIGGGGAGGKYRILRRRKEHSESILTRGGHIEKP